MLPITPVPVAVDVFMGWILDPIPLLWIGGLGYVDCTHMIANKEML